MLSHKINRYWTLGHRLPTCLSIPLYGDRQQYGSSAQQDDEDWRMWEACFSERYELQRSGIGKLINDWGFHIFSDIDIQDKRVLEIGPGTLPHFDFWDSQPSHYSLYDTRPDLLETSQKILQEKGISVSTHWNDGSSISLPFEDNEFDVMLSFSVLEHLDPMDLYLQEIKRIVKNGGIIAGAIPSDGGIFWGTGRFLTTRRMVLSQYALNFNKVISWEHPNFAEKIFNTMDDMFVPQIKRYWPLKIPLIDINFVLGFVYQVNK